MRKDDVIPHSYLFRVFVPSCFRDAFFDFPVTNINQPREIPESQNGLSDALSWEILFWEMWKQSDEGFLKFNRDKIEEYLQHDNKGWRQISVFRQSIIM